MGKERPFPRGWDTLSCLMAQGRRKASYWRWRVSGEPVPAQWPSISREAQM